MHRSPRRTLVGRNSSIREQNHLPALDPPRNEAAFVLVAITVIGGDGEVGVGGSVGKGEAVRVAFFVRVEVEVPVAVRVAVKGGSGGAAGLALGWG